MNARAIKKRLMQGRTGTFFGSRAWVRVRLPADLVGTPPPPTESVLPKGFIPASFGGMWNNETTDETIHIHNWGGRNPNEGNHPAHEKPLFIEPSESVDGYWEFWTGHHCIPNGKDEKGDQVYRFESIPDEWVAAYRAEKLWKDGMHEYGKHPVLDAFIRAGNHAKATDFDLFGNQIDVTYRVKWFSFRSKFAFCRALSKALKAAKSAGIKTHVLKRGEA